jgi:hypothetical protein
MGKQIISLSVWKNRFDKALKIKSECPERMIELFNEYSEYYLAHRERLTNGELYAFDRLGLEIQKEKEKICLNSRNI